MNKDTVGHLLEMRPDVEQLREQGIYKDGVADSILSTKERLEKQMLTNHLGHMLESRPSLSDLKHRNIIKDVGVAGGVVASKKSFVKDSLATQLRDRPTRAEMQQVGVLNDDSQDYDYVDGREYSDDEDDDDYYEEDDDFILVDGNIGNKYLSQSPTRRVQQQKAAKVVSKKQSSESNTSRISSASGYSAYLDEDSRYFSPETTQLRRRYGVALKGAAQLYNQGVIDNVQKAALKELILSSDDRVMAAVEVYELDQDDIEVLDTLARIANRGLVEMEEMYNEYDD